jgi:hypothetical protein
VATVVETVVVGMLALNEFERRRKSLILSEPIVF